MNWLDKIPQWIKIPLKILLPALCIFSGFLLLISDKFADKLYLKTFREESGFAFGLIFIITLSLILVYIMFFAVKPLINKLKDKVYKINIMKNVKNLKGNEKLIIYALHNIPVHAYTFPMNDPTINLLSSRGMVYTYNQQVDVFSYDYQYGIIYGLQPAIEEAICEILKKQANKIEKLQNFYSKVKNENKKKQIKKELDYEKKSFKDLTTLSLDIYYKGEK